MLINFTNHPSAKWSQEQLNAAEFYGEILDFPFPAVEPGGDEEYIAKLAARYAKRILANNPAAVLCQGEMTLAFAVANILAAEGITVLAACTKRVVTDGIGANGEAIKIAEFGFVRFRAYCRNIGNIY
jgi:hypothetical protein